MFHLRSNRNMYVGFHVTSLKLFDPNKTATVQQILVSLPSTLHKNPFSGSQITSCIQTTILHNFNRHCAQSQSLISLNGNAFTILHYLNYALKFLPNMINK